MPGGSEGRGGTAGGCAVLSQVVSLSFPDEGVLPLSPPDVSQSFDSPVLASRQQFMPPVGSAFHPPLLLSLAVMTGSASNRAVTRIWRCLCVAVVGVATRGRRCASSARVLAGVRPSWPLRTCDLPASVCFPPEPSGTLRVYHDRRPEVPQTCSGRERAPPRCIHGGRNASSNHFAAARTIACTRLYSWACSVPCAPLHPCAPNTAHGGACISAALRRLARSHTSVPVAPTRGPPCTARRYVRLLVGHTVQGTASVPPRTWGGSGRRVERKRRPCALQVQNSLRGLCLRREKKVRVANAVPRLDSSHALRHYACGRPRVGPARAKPVGRYRPASRRWPAPVPRKRPIERRPSALPPPLPAPRPEDESPGLLSVPGSAPCPRGPPRRFSC